MSASRSPTSPKGRAACTMTLRRSDAPAEATAHQPVLDAAWSNDGRAYSAWCMNVERLVPWRTLTGRQTLYVDHPWYLDFGEHIPTYKPKLDPRKTGDIVKSRVDDRSLVLNYITPHGKWNIHSTYKDNHRMLMLSRGMDPVWINDRDAAKVGIEDNDWVEVYNDNGVVVTRANVSRRIQPGTCMYYHAVERTVYIPKSQERRWRGGGHNSLTRTRINPVFWRAAMPSSLTASTTGAPLGSLRATPMSSCARWRSWNGRWRRDYRLVSFA